LIVLRIPQRNQGAGRQKGYALLVVLFMAAVVAISLALSLPRAAVESQRAKEDALIYRGSQYSRAVQLYFRKYRKYPASMDDLEKTNNVRFLRRRFTDPITKSEEWRIVHIGPAGIFTDSLVYDRPKKNPDGTTQAGAAPPSSPFGPTASPDTSGAAVSANGQQAGAGMADHLRATAGGAQQQPSDPNNPGQQNPYGQPGYFNQAQPGAYGQPGQPGVQQPGLQQPGLQQPGVQNAYNPGQPGGPYSGGATAASGFQNGVNQPGINQPGMNQPGMNQPGMNQPGMNQHPGFAQPGTAGAQSPFGGPNTAGVLPPVGGISGAAAAGVGPAMGSEASRIIGQLLTTPRPGGLAGLQGMNQPGGGFGSPGAAGGSAFGNAGGSAFGNTTTGSFGTPAGAGAVGAGGAVFGGGIAGVASKSEDRGIKVFKDKENYNLWEFVYDYRKDPALMGAAATTGGLQPGQQQTGVPGTGTASAFGQSGNNSGFGSTGGQSAFGNNSSFGQSGFGQPAGQSGFGQPNPGQSGFGQPNQPGFGQPGSNQVPVNPTQPGIGPGSIAVPSVPPLAVPAPGTSLR